MEKMNLTRKYLNQKHESKLVIVDFETVEGSVSLTASCHT